MNRLTTGIRCGVLLSMMLLVSSCASTLYVAARCDKEKKNEVFPVYNATRIDIMFIQEIWKEWPGRDYVLPPWLDSSLNIGCGIIDIPISFVFDTVTLPFQGIDYCVRKDQIRNKKESIRQMQSIGSNAPLSDL